MFRTVLLIFASASFVAAVPARQPEWFRTAQEIKILESNFNDVLRLFGPKADANKKFVNFKDEVWLTEDGDAHWMFYFTRGNMCSIGSRGINVTGNVPERTVRSISVSPAQDSYLYQLPYALADFEMSRQDDNTVYYTSRDRGVYVETGADGRINKFVFLPPETTDSLKCPPNKFQ